MVRPMLTTIVTLAALRQPITHTRRCAILSEAVASDGYLAQVDVVRESLVMLKVTYHPNWHAYVDGVEAGIVMLMPSYVGVKIAPGVHSVRLAYQPGPLRGGLMGLGLLVLALTGLAEWRTIRRVAVPTAPGSARN
jgi:uncharacterized membrane protein YfhO